MIFADTVDGVLCLLSIGVVLWGLVGAGIGAQKGSPFLGLFLGGLFGPIGCLIMWFERGNQVYCPACDKLISPNATRCPYCRELQFEDDEDDGPRAKPKRRRTVLLQPAPIPTATVEPPPQPVKCPKCLAVNTLPPPLSGQPRVSPVVFKCVACGVRLSVNLPP